VRSGRPLFVNSTPVGSTSLLGTSREHYDKLSLVAEDIKLISAPASEAYVERVFSVCGMLITGRRNRMTKSLEMTACLKLNRKVLAATGFNKPQ